VSAEPCLEAFAAILALLAATGGAVALLGARRARRRRREAFAQAPRSARPPAAPRRPAWSDPVGLPRAPSYTEREEPETIVLPPRGADVRFAPDVRTVSPDAVTKPYPPPATTLATTKGDAFDRAVEEERRALRHRKDRP
jgi:hypothetical protein